MSIKMKSDLEKNLADDLLWGFGRPLCSLPTKLDRAQTTQEELALIKTLVQNHFSKDGETPVDLQDQKIGEIFDTAMKNMARNAVTEALEAKERIENLYYAIECASYQMRPTWVKMLHGYTQRGVDLAHKALSKVGLVSEEKKEEDFELVEGEDDWNEVTTHESFVKTAVEILERWKKYPELLLKTSPTDELIDYLRLKLCEKQVTLKTPSA